MKNYKIGERKLNEARSITKISKELASVTSKMKELADEFYSKPEEERVEEIKNELRELTPKKHALVDELDASVAGKDRNVELIIQEKSDRELFYNHINESAVNENDKYVVIDPKGNPGPATIKIQAFQHAKKKGGNKKGFFVVLAKNARKAQKLVGKHGGNLPEKAQDKMFDMMYEGYKSNIKKKWDSTDAMLDDLREFILDAKDSGGEDLVRDIHNALRLMTNYAEGELKEGDVYEGNAFLGARAKAIEEELEEFEFNGKIYPVIKKAVNENKIDVALNKMDEWLPEDPEAMERYYEIVNQEGWKEMEQFFNEYGDEDVLQSYGLKSRDMKKLAQAAMESFSEVLSAYSKINEKVTKKDIIKTIKEISKKHKSSFINPFLMHEEPTHMHKKLGPVKIHPGVRAYDWRNDDEIAVSTSLQGSKDWNFTGADFKDLDELPKNFKLPKEWLPESVEITEALARGLKPLLKIGSTITKKDGEDALLDLSDKFDRIDDESAGNIASHLNMAIENIQDGYAKDATGWLKSFNKACKDVLNGKEVGSAFENVLTERKIQTKRKYTENHPAESVGKAARIRNKILEAIKDGKMTQDEFDSLVKELSSDHKRWMKRNGKMFNVSEDGISLSKFGQRILNGIKVNESFASFISK